LNISELNPDFYTGTLHKWMLAPKGSSFLYVKKGFQEMLDPLIVGWGYESVNPGESQFLDYQEYQGTREISAFLCTPKVIDFLEENNWKTKAKACRDIVLNNYQRFCDLLGTEPLCPITEGFLAQMASIPIRTSDAVALKDLLFNKYKIEIPVMPLNGSYFLRYSISAYNSQADLEVLYKALQDIIATTDLIEL
jgi:isopenicillin-N epimerase